NKITKLSRSKIRWLNTQPLILIFLGLVLPVFNGQAQTSLLYPQDFEGTHGWTLSNGTQTNQWVVGTAVKQGGASSLYISNDNGLTNNYTNNSTSTVHAYKDFTIPVNTSDIVIEFDWRAEAEGGWDYLNVWLVSTAYTPTVGTEISVATDRILLFED